MKRAHPMDDFFTEQRTKSAKIAKTLQMASARVSGSPVGVEPIFKRPVSGQSMAMSIGPGEANAEPSVKTTLPNLKPHMPLPSSNKLFNAKAKTSDTDDGSKNNIGVKKGVKDEVKAEIKNEVKHEIKDEAKIASTD
jgi:hypothetical protein